jgi:hypothetical protein
MSEERIHHRGTEEDEGAQREERDFFSSSVPPHPPLCLCGESSLLLIIKVAPGFREAKSLAVMKRGDLLHLGGGKLEVENRKIFS